MLQIFIYNTPLFKISGSDGTGLKCVNGDSRVTQWSVIVGALVHKQKVTLMMTNKE